MQAVFELIGRVTQTTTVLVQGNKSAASSASAARKLSQWTCP
jgi:hypothetical protein